MKRVVHDVRAERDTYKHLLHRAVKIFNLLEDIGHSNLFASKLKEEISKTLDHYSNKQEMK